MSAPVDPYVACAFCERTVPRDKPEQRRDWARVGDGRLMCGDCQEAIEKGERSEEEDPAQG